MNTEKSLAEPQVSVPVSSFARMKHTVDTVLGKPMASFHLLLIVAVLLTGFGLVMVLSASSVEGFAKSGSSYTLFKSQLMYAVIGAGAFGIAVSVPVKLIRRISGPFLLISTLMLVLVLVPNVGVEFQGSRRWFEILGFSVQPSELAKVALCIWGAHLLATRRQANATLWELLVPLLPVAIIICVLIILEPNLSTTATIAIIVATLLWFSGLPLKVFLSFVLSVGILVVILALTSDYRSARVNSLFNRNSDITDSGYQARQATFALANGGFFGEGLGASRAKWSYLPNAHNDFIFAILGEELGLIGGLLTLALFALVAYVGFRIASRSVDPFLRLLSATITVLIVVQALINIGYVVGLLPVTGIQLPLISAGGTSTITVLTMFGLLASAARHEPEAIAATLVARRGAIARFLRMSKPVAYVPSKAEALRDRLDATRGTNKRKTTYSRYATRGVAVPGPERYRDDGRISRNAVPRKKVDPGRNKSSNGSSRRTR